MAPTIRGKVIKTPDATPGILFVDGRQRPFQMEGLWQSPVAPAPNMTVDVELNGDGGILSLQAVPDGVLAKEQATLALGSANEKGKVLASSLSAKVGKPALIATGLLAFSWFFLDFFSLAIPFTATRLHLTYWQFLGWVAYLQDAVGNPFQILAQGARPDLSPGKYGFLAIVALAGPLLPAVWKDRRALLGGLLPLALSFYIGFEIWRIVDSAQSIAQAQFGVTPQMTAMMAAQARANQDQLLNAFSPGLGGLIAGMAALFLAGAAVVKFLARKGADAV